MALHKANYDVKEETWQTQEQFQDRHLLRLINPNLANSNRVTVRKPVMKHPGTTIVALPYPEFDANGKPNGKVLNDRYDNNPSNPRSYNRWLFRAGDKGVLQFGKQWISVLFDNPEDSGWDFDTDHPIQLISRTTRYAIKKNTDVQTPYGSATSDRWKVLLEGDEAAKEFAIIKSPEVMFLVYAVIYQAGTTNYLQETGAPFGALAGEPLVVFVMTRSTGATLMDQIDMPLRNDRPDEGLLHPTVTGSRFIHFFDKKVGACPMIKHAAAPSSGQDGDDFGSTRRGPQLRMGEKPAEGFGYNVHVSETIDGLPGSRKVSRDAIAKYAQNRVLPWEQVLRGHTPDECADLVQSMAGLPLSVLAHAWQSHPEYFNSVTKAMMASRRTFDMRGIGQLAHEPVTNPTATQNVTRNVTPADSVPRVVDVDAFADIPTEDAGSPFDGNFLPPVESTPQATSTPTDKLYDPSTLKAAEDRLRGALESQAKTGTAPTLPSPPPFRSKPN